MRSAKGHVTGLNLQRIDGARLSDLNVRAHILYDESAAFAPELRQRVPDALIVLRLILNSHWGDPEGTARAGAGLVAAYPMVDILCPGNEQNHENGASSSAIAAWCERFRDEWTRQGDPRPLVTPAVSPGAPFDLAALADAWAEWDYIGVHGYTNWDDLSFGMALANIEAHRWVWPDKPQLLTEFNVDKAEEQPWRWGELAGAVDSFLGRLAGLGYVQGAMWFLDDSWVDGEWPYRLCRIPELMNLYRSIGHEQTGGPGPTPPPSGEIGRIESIYGITHADGAEFYLAALTERTDPALIEAVGPENSTVLISTNDNQHQARGSGRASLAFSHPAQYQPSQGERGFYYSTCGDARVDGLGWAYDAPPVLQGPHVNVVAHFARRSSPTPPPDTGHAWSGAFAGWADAHPEVGKPLSEIFYLPPDWATAVQISATHMLCWTGARVHQLRRDP